MIEPDWCSRIRGRECFMPRKTPSTLIAICRRKSARENSVTGPDRPMPALLTRMSRRPCRAFTWPMTSIQASSLVTSWCR